jgi:hypothetical protein
MSGIRHLRSFAAGKGTTQESVNAHEHTKEMAAYPGGQTAISFAFRRLSALIDHSTDARSRSRSHGSGLIVAIAIMVRARAFCRFPCLCHGDNILRRTYA